ncbi:MAG TPA: hypothetical protein ACFE0H_14835 [Elainellaceae cyanobacterium]
MVLPTLTKHSPLSGIYRAYSATLIDQQGWQIAEHFGNLPAEKQSLQTGAVLADWSHIGKISLSGQQAAHTAEMLCAGASSISPLTSVSTTDVAALRLTANDYLILCQAGYELSLLGQLDGDRKDDRTGNLITVVNQTGAMGCFVLAGQRRDEVFERSTAMDLRRDRLVAGAVIQTTIHTIRCTLYRTSQLDIIVHPRSLSESLFDALLDVGIRVGLVPTGLAIVPVELQAG